jgi:GNAT superfamily N-acetyltransferase
MNPRACAVGSGQRGRAARYGLAMDVSWRAPFTSTEVNALHAECFATQVDIDEEWDWLALCERHSLGWCSAREAGALVGFLNVPWDGLAHAWIQDVMVARSARHSGVGTQLVSFARERAREAGCEWLHVDFEDDLGPFYLGACGFAPAQAGLIRL